MSAALPNAAAMTKASRTGVPSRCWHETQLEDAERAQHEVGMAGEPPDHLGGVAAPHAAPDQGGD